MPQKKENLPVKVDVDLQNGGTITYANEVIATIAGVAANEIDGIAGMCISGGFSEILSRNRNITRGVKVEVGSQEAAVDLYIIVEYGKPIQKVAGEVQENVRKALESLTGLHVVRVDVHVQGVSFEKEKKAAQSSIEAAKNPVLAEPAPVPSEQAAKAEDLKAEAPAPQPEEASAAEDEWVQEEQNAQADSFDEEVLAEEAELDAAPDAEAKDEACACCEDDLPPAQETESVQAPEASKKRPGGRKRC